MNTLVWVLDRGPTIIFRSVIAHRARLTLPSRRNHLATETQEKSKFFALGRRARVRRRWKNILVRFLYSAVRADGT